MPDPKRAAQLATAVATPAVDTLAMLSGLAQPVVDKWTTALGGAPAPADRTVGSQLGALATRMREFALGVPGARDAEALGNFLPGPEAGIPMLAAITKGTKGFAKAGRLTSAVETALRNEPLGLRRSPVLDPSLAGLEWRDFQDRYQAISKHLDGLEKQLDEVPGIADADLTYRKQLIEAQDQYDAFQNEDFRRKAMGWEPDEMLYNLRSRMGRDPTPSAKMESLLILNAAKERGINLTDRLKQYASRGFDETEVAEYLVENLNRFAKELKPTNLRLPATIQLRKDAE